MHVLESQRSSNGCYDDETVARGRESRNESVRKIETVIAEVNCKCVEEWGAIVLEMCAECEHTSCTWKEVDGIIVCTLIAEDEKEFCWSDENNLSRNVAYKEYICNCYGCLGKGNLSRFFRALYEQQKEVAR